MKISVAFIPAAVCTLQLVAASPFARNLADSITTEENAVDKRALLGAERERPYSPGYSGNESPPVDECVEARNAATTWYRLYQPKDTDHFYTANVQDKDSNYKNGYIDQTSPGMILPRPIAGAVPFYRVYHIGGRDHYYTTNDADAQQNVVKHGWTRQGITGYIFDTQKCGTVPLYRLYLPFVVVRKRYPTGHVYKNNVGVQDHVYTTDAKEFAKLMGNGQGWLNQGIAGYIFPPP